MRRSRPRRLVLVWPLLISALSLACGAPADAGARAVADASAATQALAVEGEDLARHEPDLAGARGAPPTGGTSGAADLAVCDVTVVDVVAGQLLPGQTVLVADGRIEAVGPSATTPVPAATPRLHGQGRFLVPGLWDLHVHDMDDASLRHELLRHGVTSVRVMGGDYEVSLPLRDAVEAGLASGPRLVDAGPWVDGPRTDLPADAAAQRWFVSDATQARDAVAGLGALGVDLVKIHDRVPREALVALARACAEAGLPFAGHVPRGLELLEVVALGPASLEHLSMLAERMISARAADSEAAWQAVMAEWEAGPGRALAEALLARDTALVPTLVASAGITAGADGSAWDDPRAGALSDEQRSAWRAMLPTAEQWPGFAEQRALIDRSAARMLGFLHARGVRIGAGSDLGAPHVFAGSGLHDELALLVAAGLSPAAALRTATSDAALIAGRAARSGRVEVGLDADLLLLADDPLVDIAATRGVLAVVCAGRLVSGELVPPAASDR